MLERKQILNKVYHDCLCEMYAKAQPEADWDNILEEYRSGKLGKNDKVYERHYLSIDEFKYIREKYKVAYNIVKTWVPNINFLIELLNDGGLKDKYNPDWVDENGNNHPGYRSAEDVKPIKEQILSCLKKYLAEGADKDATNEIVDVIMNTINNYKNFYKFDREADDFDINISLGASPCSNAETVKKWWKENYDQDIEIEERNPKLFWYNDNGYTDEDLAYEFEDLGPNWKEVLDKEWKDEIEAKKHEQKEKLEKIKKEYENGNKTT